MNHADDLGVRLSAMRLDEELPGWAARISTRDLDSSDPHNSVLGQLARRDGARIRKVIRAGREKSWEYGTIKDACILLYGGPQESYARRDGFLGECPITLKTGGALNLLDALWLREIQARIPILLDA